MIDYLALRVPGKTPFTESFGRLYAGSRGDAKRWKSSQHYASAAAWDDCGLDVLLHVNCTMTDKPQHKLEIIRTGDKTYPEMVELAGRVFDCDPEALETMRVDLTADVHDVSVNWFKRHSYVRAKQTRRELGTVERYMTIGKGSAETLYSGVKPNQVRIYDKVAERRMQYGRYLRTFARESAELPDSAEVEATTFEAMYGHGMYDVITRVERQCAARDLERLQLTHLRSLQVRADSINPFEKMVIFDGQPLDPRIEDYEFTQWCAGMYLRGSVREFGLAETLRWLKANNPENFYRAKKTFEPFLRVADNTTGISADELKRLYQGSSYRQLQRAA